MSVTLTGNGTVNSHYIISGDNISDIWFKLVEMIAMDGIYVDLDSSKTFNLRSIYNGQTLPNFINIGYDTIVDMKDSNITGEELNYRDNGEITANSFYLKGNRGEVKNVTWLNINGDIILTDTAASTINRIQSLTKKSIIQSKANLNFDLTNVTEKTTLELSKECYWFSDGFSIRNARNLHVVGKDNNHYIYDLNIVDCHAEDSSLFDNRNYVYQIDYLTRCYIKSYNDGNNNQHSIFNGTFTVSQSTVIAFADRYYYNGMAYGYRLGNGKATFNDCIIYSYCLFFHDDRGSDTDKPSCYNCYIYGEFLPSHENKSDRRWDICRGSFNIIEIKAYNASNGNYAPQFMTNSVFCNTEGNDFFTEHLGVSLLTSEDIRNPQKLYDTGIPINPFGVAG